MEEGSNVTIFFPHNQGEIGLQQRASVVVQTGHCEIPVAITIRAVDVCGEEVRLCPKIKKDHEYVIKTLNEELFQGGAKTDVTFYCKGENTGGCKTKKPSKLRLCALLVYENGSFEKFISPTFLVKGNRRTQSKSVSRKVERLGGGNTSVREDMVRSFIPTVKSQSHWSFLPESANSVNSKKFLPCVNIPVSSPVVIVGSSALSRVGEDYNSTFYDPIKKEKLGVLSAFSKKRSCQEDPEILSPLKKMNIHNLVNNVKTTSEIEYPQTRYDKVMTYVI